MVAILERPGAPPEPSMAKRTRKMLSNVDWGKFGPGSTKNQPAAALPPLDLAAIARREHPDNAQAPRMHMGTFRMPIAASERARTEMRNRAVWKFIKIMDKQGWDWVPHLRIRVYDGIYPAPDLATGAFLLDEREYRIEAWFSLRKPQLVRVEVSPHWREPLVLRQARGAA